ncbi:MAG: hypothetical protein GY953_38415 [bacterium]|nr:hypothetical protein [bacterium]
MRGPTAPRSDRRPREEPPALRPNRRSASAYFQYLGTTGMTVRAPITGTAYRFDGPGAILAVDPRDRRALAAVPNLRQVAGL